MSNTIKNIVSGFKSWLSRHIYYNRKLHTKHEMDRKVMKLGAVIECHIDDEDWLMAKLGVDDHYQFRTKKLMIDRDKIEAFINHNIN